MKTVICAIAGVSAVLGQGVWERRAPYPISATEVSAASLNGRVFAVCGLVAGRSVNSLFVYNPRRDEWTEGAPLPILDGSDHCNAAAAGGRFYVLGAIRIGSTFIDGNTYEYDPQANRWQTVAQMPTPRGASGVAVIGSRIYVAGGLAQSGSVASFEAFDTATRQWTRLPDMPTARDHLTAQAARGKFYAIAGRAAQQFTANEEYDPATNMWTARAPIPTSRGGLGSGIIGGRIQVFGGEGSSGTPEGTYRQNEEFDPATNTWRALAPMPTPRHGLYGATVDGRIFTPSGGPREGASFSDVHEAFYLPPSPPAVAGAAGMVNAASGVVGALTPGAAVSWLGERMSAGEQEFTRFPMPSRMNAVQVLIEGTPAPLYYVGPSQVNFQLPVNLAGGPARISLWNAGVESQPVEVQIAETAPGLFSISQDGRGQGAILIAGSATVASPATPVRRGQFIEIYATGLGRVTDPPDAGEPALSDPLSETFVMPVVTIGGVRAVVAFSGLAPGFAGLYQVNAQVPEAAPTGPAVPVMIQIPEDGPRSNTVTIAVAN